MAATTATNQMEKISLPMPTQELPQQLPIIQTNTTSQKQRDHLQRAREIKKQKSEEMKSDIENILTKLEVMEEKIDNITAAASNTRKRKQIIQYPEEAEDIGESQIILPKKQKQNEPDKQQQGEVAATGSGDIFTEKFLIFCGASIACLGGILVGSNLDGARKLLTFYNGFVGGSSDEIIFRN
jgi:hypothetical protein